MANNKFLRHGVVALGAILGLAIVTPLLAGFGGFLTTSLGGFSNLSLAGVIGAGTGSWVSSMVTDRYMR